MNNKEKVLDVALKRYAQKTAFIKEALDKRGVSRKETTLILKDIELDRAVNRVDFVRDLDNKLEHLINQHINGEDMSYIVRKLNNYIDEKYSNIGMTTNVVKSFVASRHYNTVNDMRAFKALCDGDLETYNLFAGGSKELLMSSIIRVLSLVLPSNVEVMNLEKVVTDKFGGEGKDNSPSIYAKVLKRDMGKDGYLIKYYKEKVDSSTLCFYEGVLSILEPVLKECGCEISCDKNEDVVEDEASDLIDSLLNETENCAAAPTLQGTEDNDKREEIASDIKSEVTTENLENEDDLMVLKKKVAECIEIIAKLEERQSVKDVSSTSELEELKIENAKLRNENEILKVKAEGASLKEFIQKAGGRDANYQLSELYLLAEDMIEEDGNTIGRFINVLTMLEAFGISAYFGGKKYLEEFEIERKELAKKYTLEMPLVGANEVVKVRLIKNGWMQDGNVIVLPLVKQI